MDLLWVSNEVHKGICFLTHSRIFSALSFAALEKCGKKEKRDNLASAMLEFDQTYPKNRDWIQEKEEKKLT